MKSIPFRSALLRRTALAATVFLAACSPTSPEHGDPDATLAYWEKMHQVGGDLSDIDAALAGWQARQTPLNGEYAKVDGMILALAAELVARNEKLAELPMRGVDPALLEHTKKVIALNLAGAELLTQMRTLISQTQNLTDPGQLSIDYLFGLMRHSEDENPFTSALVEQLHEKANTVGKTQPLLRDLEAKAAAIATQKNQIKADEAAVRATLHQHHPHEFKPVSSLTSPSSAATDAAPLFTKRRVALDLLGEKCDGWTFDSLDEFQRVEITESRSSNDQATIRATCDVVGRRSGDRRTLVIDLAYCRSGDAWVLQTLTSIRAP